MNLIRMALEVGADLAGLAPAESLQEKGALDPQVLPSARTVVVVACAHSRSALLSSNLQVKQYDTISAYENVRSVCDRIVKQLEKSGHEALSVPAFIPIDMAEGKWGMIGAVDHRAAAVEAGIGTYGKSGLLLTPVYGPRVRLGSVLTSLKFKTARSPLPSLCPAECTRCLEGCPAGALRGPGNIDKKKCARRIFAHGLRKVIQVTGELLGGTPAERARALHGFEFHELWQNFMTGNYYDCFACQSLCPAGGRPQSGSRKRFDNSVREG